ncbi:hypothetical protein PUN4_210021 [Paraburkholderia unamae]|nr:hypothetical protein PUN4_210021 [Paraburkholderia unamae]
MPLRDWAHGSPPKHRDVSGARVIPLLFAADHNSGGLCEGPGRCLSSIWVQRTIERLNSAMAALAAIAAMPLTAAYANCRKFLRRMAGAPHLSHAVVRKKAMGQEARMRSGHAWLPPGLCGRGNGHLRFSRLHSRLIGAPVISEHVCFWLSFALP